MIDLIRLLIFFNQFQTTFNQHWLVVCRSPFGKRKKFVQVCSKSVLVIEKPSFSKIVEFFYSTGAVSMRNFFRKLLYDRYSRIPTDVYTSIFLCDFINIFVFIFGFAAVTVSEISSEKILLLPFFGSNLHQNFETVPVSPSKISTVFIFSTKVIFALINFKY